jgi:2-hydroxychromene-2-carboxylate isomerase
MRLEFFFDYPSPYAYLANTQLPKLGVDIVYTPIGIRSVMKLVNNQPTPACPAKARYAVLDATRWANSYGVPFQVNAAFVAALRSGDVDIDDFGRGALLAQDLGVFEAYNTAIFRAIWARPHDLISALGRNTVLRVGGLDIPDFWARASAPELHERLERNNRRAAERGVFGVPTFFVDDEIFFGNDRLDVVRARLSTPGQPAPRMADAG